MKKEPFNNTEKPKGVFPCFGKNPKNKQSRIDPTNMDGINNETNFSNRVDVSLLTNLPHNNEIK